MEAPGGDRDTHTRATELRLRIDSDEPLSGTLQAAGDADATPFEGWVELMAAITSARGRALGREQGEAGGG